MAVDVYIELPVRGSQEWLLLATNADQSTYERIKYTSCWRVSSTPSEHPDTEPVTVIYADTLDPWLSSDVWMLYPSVNQKESWGRIAYAVTADTARAYAANPYRRLSIQPSPGGLVA